MDNLAYDTTDPHQQEIYMAGFEDAYARRRSSAPKSPKQARAAYRAGYEAGRDARLDDPE